MKHIIVSLGLIIAASQVHLSAADYSNPLAQATLEKIFVGAKDIRWNTISKHNISEARFTYNNEVLVALFEQDGTFISSSRSILPANLPLLVQREIHNSYPKHTVREIVEKTTNEQTTYLVHLDGKKGEIVIEAYPNGGISIIKKEKRK